MIFSSFLVRRFFFTAFVVTSIASDFKSRTQTPNVVSFQISSRKKDPTKKIRHKAKRVKASVDGLRFFFCFGFVTATRKLKIGRFGRPFVLSVRKKSEPLKSRPHGNMCRLLNDGNAINTRYDEHYSNGNDDCDGCGDNTMSNDCDSNNTPLKFSKASSNSNSSTAPAEVKQKQTEHGTHQQSFSKRWKNGKLAMEIRSPFIPQFFVCSLQLAQSVFDCRTKVYRKKISSKTLVRFTRSHTQWSTISLCFRTQFGRKSELLEILFLSMIFLCFDYTSFLSLFLILSICFCIVYCHLKAILKEFIFLLRS